MSFVEALELKNMVYDAFTNFIRPKAILFRDQNNQVGIDAFLKHLYENTFDGCSYDDLSGHMQRKIAITLIIGKYLEDKSLLNLDKLDDFEKNLLLETAFSELKAIDKKFFMSVQEEQKQEGSSTNLILAIIFTLVGVFFIRITFNDPHTSQIEVLPFYALFIGAAIYNWKAYFSK